MWDQTYSYIFTDEVIGRDHDKNTILDILLGSSSTGNDLEPQNEVLSIIPNVGIGSMWKISLAQLLYIDL